MVCTRLNYVRMSSHDDVIKWKHFPRYWPFVRGIHRSPVNSPHKGQWCGALMFSLICVWINGWVNNSQAGDVRRYRAHYDVTVMLSSTQYMAHLYMDIYVSIKKTLTGWVLSVAYTKIDCIHPTNWLEWRSCAKECVCLPKRVYHYEDVCVCIILLQI